jgi:anion-transporting  ArsA/GET3 family ATPase
MDARRVQVIGGKGGVGRTTVACALALAHAARGERTLLLEVNAQSSAAERLGVAPAPDEPREVLNNLWLCNMTPAGSLREYALLILRFKALYRLVFENRLVKYLLRSIPSLAEVTMAGKFWYHAVEDPRRRPARNTTASSSTRRRPVTPSPSWASLESVADLAPGGRMKREVSRMAELIESPDTCLHVVTRPEEMPVNEALDLERRSSRAAAHALGGRASLNYSTRTAGCRSSERACLRRIRTDTRNGSLLAGGGVLG